MSALNLFSIISFSKQIKGKGRGRGLRKVRGDEGDKEGEGR